MSESFANNEPDEPLELVPEPAPPRYGASQQITPLIRRVLAPNPSPFSYTGSGTYIIGTGHVAVIDPGPLIDTHVHALLAATEGETISHILITHTHRDHSPAALPLKAHSGALICGCAPLLLADDGPRSDEAFDDTYVPDQVLADGDSLRGPNWTLTAVATPGHTSNHLCFALAEEQALFSGDHVMGWSTTVIAPPDGDMAAYMASLRKLLDRKDKVFYPTHGCPIDKPQRFVRALLAHRRQREGQILRLLEEGAATIPDMVKQIYASTPSALHGAAGRSMLAHLIDLQTRGVVRRDADRYMLA